LKRPAYFKLAASAARILVLTAMSLALYIRVFEDRLLFYPEPELVGAPSVPYEDVDFEAADGVALHGWWIPTDSARALIVSHGNAGNIGDRASMGEFLREEFGINVFMYDYRGFGQSQGRPTEDGLYADIRGAYRWIGDRGFAPEDIYLFGQSLGSAVAIDLAVALFTATPFSASARSLRGALPKII